MHTRLKNSFISNFIPYYTTGFSSGRPHSVKPLLNYVLITIQRHFYPSQPLKVSGHLKEKHFITAQHTKLFLNWKHFAEKTSLI